MKSTFMKGLTKHINRAGLQLKKHSPEILVAVGVVGTVVGTIMACKATTKAGDILEKAKKDVDTIHKCAADESLADTYTPEDVKKDLAVVYIQTGVRLAGLFAPAASISILSIGCILASNDILRKRNLALAAACATAERGFKEYRNRVIERFGKEIDHELKHNIRAITINETQVNEDGTEETVEKTITVVDSPDEHSCYARFFDSSSRSWEKDPEYNLMFLRAEQQYANDKLKADGYLFLNEVYERLDFPRTKAGQCVGWIYNPENPNGDNYVDFGIYDTYKEATRRFVNGYEPVYLLDFNVDGNILDLIPSRPYK